MDLALFLRRSAQMFACSQVKTSKWAHEFFLIFCMKLVKVRKVTQADFWKKSPVESGGPQKFQKWGFGDFDKNLSHSYVLFLLEYKSI